MMAFAWTNTEADCTIVSSEPPEAGIVHVEIEDGTLVVQRMDGRRVDRVRFVPHPLPEGAPEAETLGGGDQP